MGFYNRKLVRKPRKERKCYLCGEVIKGEHWYISAKGDDFWTGHAHIACEKAAEDMCARCLYRNDCCSDIEDCFNNMTS